MSAGLVILEERLRIPAEACSFAGFRDWSASDRFPEDARIDFLAGDIEVEMSPEDLHTHGVVKAAIAAALHALLAANDRGEVFIDRARVVSEAAGLSAEPDVVAVLWSSLESGRVRYRASARRLPDRFSEIEGAPDLVVEVLSDASESKDTERLPLLYARAGIPELWLVDARGSEPRFEIHALAGDRYERLAADPDGTVRSPVLGLAVRLVRQRTRLGSWRYTLEHSED